MRHKVLGFFKVFLIFTLIIVTMHLILLYDKGIITGYSVRSVQPDENPMIVPALAVISLVLFLMILNYKKKYSYSQRHIKIKNLREDSPRFIQE